MAENSKKRKPGQKDWEVITVGGENQTYVPPANVPGNENETPDIPGSPSLLEPTPEEKTETAIDELRSRYMAELRTEYENAMNLLKDERDEALRENWILQQRAKASLSEQLAAGGINGGAAETSLANLGAEYQGNRNDIRSDYIEKLGELSGKQSEKKAELEKDYMDKWLEYLMGITEMEKKHELEKMYG